MVVAMKSLSDSLVLCVHVAFRISTLGTEQFIIRVNTTAAVIILYALSRSCQRTCWPMKMSMRCYINVLCAHRDSQSTVVRLPAVFVARCRLLSLLKTSLALLDLSRSMRILWAAPAKLSRQHCDRYTFACVAQR